MSNKESWWLNEEVQKVKGIDFFEGLQKCINEINLEKHKLKKAKKEVSKKKSRAYENLHEKVETKTAKKDIYKLAKMSGKQYFKCQISGKCRMS